MSNYSCITVAPSDFKLKVWLETGIWGDPCAGMIFLEKNIIDIIVLPNFS
ncbi:hypothetical protein CDL15_Pgr027272 [Punica granatum]|uniref:Uncharacterized protein n=1 Tax=Punica granatum TaxID=22663 RepID=A0A218XMZ9_PUNGR|nr:hypothetical protein CDL15_Pgr027272 [Punica granatum]